MELRLAFTEFLFAFCAVVLADRAHGFSERILTALGWARSVETRPAPALETGMTCDWYVHFYRSELTGDDRRPARPGAVTPAVRHTRSDSRPRLQA
jgi:hypothetical protein